MKSKIRVELDDLNNPIIEITVPQNMDEEDLRDKVLSKFLNGAVYFELEISKPTSLFKGPDKDETKYTLRPVKREQLHTPQVDETDHNYINLAYNYGAKGIFLNSPYKRGDVITYDYFSNKARNEDNKKIWYCSTKPCNGHIGAIIDCAAKMNSGTSGISPKTSGTSGSSGYCAYQTTSGIDGFSGTTGWDKFYNDNGSRGSSAWGTSGSSAWKTSGSSAWKTSGSSAISRSHKSSGSSGKRKRKINDVEDIAGYMTTQFGDGTSGTSGYSGT